MNHLKAINSIERNRSLILDLAATLNLRLNEFIVQVQLRQSL